MVISDDEKKNMIRNWYSDEDEKYIASLGEEYEQRFSATKKTGGGCAILTTKNCYLQGEYSDKIGKKAQNRMLDMIIPITKIDKVEVRYSHYELIKLFIKIIMIVLVIAIATYIYTQAVIDGVHGCEHKIETNEELIEECEDEIQGVTTLYHEFINDESKCMEECFDLAEKLKETGIDTPGVTYEYFTADNGNTSLRVTYDSKYFNRSICIGYVRSKDISDIWGTNAGASSHDALKNRLETTWNDEAEILKIYYNEFFSDYGRIFLDYEKEMNLDCREFRSDICDKVDPILDMNVTSLDERNSMMATMDDAINEYIDECEDEISSSEKNIRKRNFEIKMLHLLGIGIILITTIIVVVIGFKMKVKIKSYFCFSYITDELDVNEMHLLIDKQMKTDVKSFIQKFHYLRANN